MRYLTSIISTVFLLVAIAAFGAQLAVYAVAPAAQYVVMLFLLVFCILIWVAEVQSAHQQTAYNLRYRMITEHEVFPVVAYIVQLIFAIVYFVGWNLPPSPQTLALRVAVPKGVFVPLVIELVLLFVVLVLWLGNRTANRHTEQLEQKRAVSISQLQQLQAQVEYLGSRIDESDTRSQDIMRLIQEKAESLPLNLDPTTKVFYQQSLQKIAAAGSHAGYVTQQELDDIKQTIDRIR